MTLSVMSAFVAFNGFPGQDVQDPPIGSLLVQERQATIDVPVHPLRVAVPASGSSRAATAADRRAGRAPASKTPLAHSNPVVNRAPAAPQPTRTVAPRPAAPVTAPATAVTTPLTGGGTPPLPSTGVPVPAVPAVPLPALPQGTQLPLNTSGVTKALGSG